VKTALKSANFAVSAKALQLKTAILLNIGGIFR
jgi:hypothetical protein